MTHQQLEFEMPANADVVFDAFHYHVWRERWDSLLAHTRVEGGAPCPSVGAITTNTGGGWLGGLSMRTRFVSYDRPRLAAATMVERSFPFTRWAASMRHTPVSAGHSLMVYTYTFEVGPTALRWPLSCIVATMFERQTRQRFTRLQAFLAKHAGEVEQWQTSKP